LRKLAVVCRVALNGWSWIAGCRPVRALILASDRINPDRIHRYILVSALVAGWNCRNGIDHIHTFRDPAEYCVAELPITVIEKRIVAQVDKKLGCRAVDHRGSRHCQGSAKILLAVIRFVLDRIPGLLLRQVVGHTATLDHEIRDDAMKNRIVEEFIGNVLPKIFTGDRCCCFEEFDDNVAMICAYRDHNGPRQIRETGVYKNVSTAV
jgi:hypothetical protein